MTATGPADPPGRLAARTWRRLRTDRRLVGALAVAAVAAVLFSVYLLLARTNPTNADGAANAVQAWDMLHGNVLLHGWTVSDVPFWSTEVPQYALIELVAGYGPDVPHLAAALTYTLLVLLAAAVAKGNATGRAAAVRITIAVAVLLTPAPGNGYAILLLIPDHTGTAVPLLLAWLLLSRVGLGARASGDLPQGGGAAQASDTPSQDRRVAGSWTAVAVALILGWTQIGDPLALFVGAVPLTLVSLFRLFTHATGRVDAERRLTGLGERESGTIEAASKSLVGRRRLDWRGLDARLALAGVASVVLAQVVLNVVHAAGGFSAHPPIAAFAARSALAENFRITGRTLAVNFGAYFPDYRTSFPGHLAGFGLIVWLAHLVALLFVGVAVVVAVSRLVARRDSDRITGVLAVAILVNLGAFVISTQPAGLDTARQIVPVLPLGAALAGRLCGDAIRRTGAMPVATPFLAV
ncbi:MAG: hypothetical protein ACJ786_13685, partial [Catenulispora sp.]